LVCRRVLHHRHQRLHRAEGQTLAGSIVRKSSRGQAQVDGKGRADAGDEHALAHLTQELTPVSCVHRGSPVTGSTPLATLGHCNLTAQRYTNLPHQSEISPSSFVILCSTRHLAPRTAAEVMPNCA